MISLSSFLRTKEDSKTGFYTRPIELTTKRRRVKCKITRGCAICSSDKFKSEEKNSTSQSLITSDDQVPPVGLACTLVAAIRRIFKSHVTMQPPIVSYLANDIYLCLILLGVSVSCVAVDIRNSVNGTLVWRHQSRDVNGVPVPD